MKIWNITRILTIFTIANLFINTTYAEPHSTFSKGRDYYEKRGDIVWEVPTKNKVIALTFDDGPDYTKTPAILNLLKKYQAKATFFVVGNRVEKYPEIVKRAYLEGHEIGNHSFDHASFQNIPRTKLLNELTRTQEAIYKAIGQKATLFRPPGGSYSESAVNICKDNQLLMILWSWDQDTKDWMSPGVNKIVNKVLNNVDNGDIVLMHDFVHNSVQTVDALTIILPELIKRGYSFVTVSDLISNKENVGQDIRVTH
ncbi:polysaccharide deacetylase family protein [Paenibacillus macquariensis]|uniref:Polysaccharide deacetylase family sporulation protein PdaB n=1 Tax=Paenibacillus macquariensis TaxID=948756 RepID=A0ABY1K3C5_9BACL|nr:polysaccharide deacetylase family protein [Paenibacillus macquariensis]MEC0090329.1 polysaccharide deacetylase family protein [Paenibacillus macquariensis]OAB39684.1 polysaccharide deacetylase [Paenibacillus macquariensis subsp. macquariensis]SIR19519.1 polysaccharide deacetylase family sporulation protein PdaB [Paenibacillus macquariensis]